MPNTDLDDIQAAQTIKMVGADLVTGAETYPVGVTADGRLRVNSTSYIPDSILVNLFKYLTVTPVAGNRWHDVLSYTVPTGYNLDCISLTGDSTSNDTRYRIVKRMNFGSWNMATRVFVDGGSWTAPRFSGELMVLVTTTLGATNQVMTFTYTNQDGVVGRTATLPITKNTVVGTRIPVPLQTGDYGVRDITAVSQTAIEAGAIDIEGYTGLIRLHCTTTGIIYEAFRAAGSVVVAGGESIILQYWPPGTGALTINPSVVAILNPKVSV